MRICVHMTLSHDVLIGRTVTSLESTKRWRLRSVWGVCGFDRWSFAAFIHEIMDMNFLENKDRSTVVVVPTFLAEFASGESEDNFTNASSGMQSFIFTPYAFTISGLFVWCALFLTCFQVGKLLASITVSLWNRGPAKICLHFECQKFVLLAQGALHKLCNFSIWCPWTVSHRHRSNLYLCFCNLRFSSIWGIIQFLNNSSG